VPNSGRGNAPAGSEPRMGLAVLKDRSRILGLRRKLVWLLGRGCKFRAAMFTEEVHSDGIIWKLGESDKKKHALRRASMNWLRKRDVAHSTRRAANSKSDL
jgi:hypothetical protein